MTCVYRAFENGELVATGRLTLDSIPSVGEELRLNGKAYLVRTVEYGGGEQVVELEAH